MSCSFFKFSLKVVNLLLQILEKQYRCALAPKSLHFSAKKRFAISSYLREWNIRKVSALEFISGCHFLFKLFTCINIFTLPLFQWINLLKKDKPLKVLYQFCSEIFLLFDGRDAYFSFFFFTCIFSKRQKYKEEALPLRRYLIEFPLQNQQMSSHCFSGCNNSKASSACNGFYYYHFDEGRMTKLAFKRDKPFSLLPKEII